MSAGRLRLVSVVVPVLNEAAHLPELLRRLRAVVDVEILYRFEFVFVDDGSQDDTVPVLWRPRRLTRCQAPPVHAHLGQQVALTDG